MTKRKPTIDKEMAKDLAEEGKRLSDAYRKTLKEMWSISLDQRRLRS